MKTKFKIVFGNPSSLYWYLLPYYASFYKEFKPVRRKLNHLICVSYKNLPLQSRKVWKRNKK